MEQTIKSLQSDEQKQKKNGSESEYLSIHIFDHIWVREVELHHEEQIEDEESDIVQQKHREKETIDEKPSHFDSESAVEHIDGQQSPNLSAMVEEQKSLHSTSKNVSANEDQRFVEEGVSVDSALDEQQCRPSDPHTFPHQRVEAESVAQVDEEEEQGTEEIHFVEEGEMWGHLHLQSKTPSHLHGASFDHSHHKTPHSQSFLKRFEKGSVELGSYVTFEGEQSQTHFDEFHKTHQKQVHEQTVLEDVLSRIQKVHIWRVVFVIQIQVLHTPRVLTIGHVGIAEEVDDVEELRTQFEWLDDGRFFQNPSHCFRIVQIPSSVVSVQTQIVEECDESDEESGWNPQSTETERVSENPWNYLQIDLTEQNF